ncbi:tyrosine-type recombinase/integrase [Nocardia sp. NPDC003482]
MTQTTQPSTTSPLAVSTPAAPTAEAVAAARLLLSQMGITPADLVAAVTTPTFAEVIPKVRATLSDGTLRTYRVHLARLETEWGTRRLDEPTRGEVEDMARAVRANARTNRASRGGGSAVEHFIAAIRCVYRHAEAQGRIRPGDNPARALAKPPRRASHRYAIPSHQLAEICTVAARSGNDPDLDSLILRLHIETACRRSGALALRPHDLDPDRCVIWLREKGGTDRWQPVSPTLMRHLQQHARDRRAPQSERLLRYRDGRPITSRRYDHLWARLGEELPWIALQGVTAHWLRHTTLTWVERTFNYAVASAYAGHSGKAHGTTATYVKADLLEVAAAVSVLTGEPHPLTSAPEAHR